MHFRDMCKNPNLHLDYFYNKDKEWQKYFPSFDLWLFVSFLEAVHVSKQWLKVTVTQLDIMQPGIHFSPLVRLRQNRVRAERPVSCEREPRGVYGVEGNSGTGACVTCPLLSVQLWGECKLSVPQGQKNAGYAQQLCSEEPLECQACVWSAVTHCRAVTWANKGSTLLKKRGEGTNEGRSGVNTCAHTPPTGNDKMVEAYRVKCWKMYPFTPLTPAALAPNKCF